MINLELKTPQNEVITQDKLCLTEKGDLTLMLIQDWGVLQPYHTFLKDWIKIFRNVTTGNTCNTKLSDFISESKKWVNERGVRRPKMRKHKLTKKPGRNNSLRQNLRKRSQRNRLKKQKGPTLYTCEESSA